MKFGVAQGVSNVKTKHCLQATLAIRFQNVTPIIYLDQ